MTDRVTMKALDTMHLSNVSADNINEGDVFTVSEADAKFLEDRGLAERGGTASKALNADAAGASRPETRDELDAERGAAVKPISAENKMAAAPENKAAITAPAKAKRK